MNSRALFFVSCFLMGWGNLRGEVTKGWFGTLPNGKVAHWFLLTNQCGMKVKLIEYGAAIVSILVPDRAGKLSEVVLGFDSLQKYLGPYNQSMGATIGRYAGRIANGQLPLEGRIYQLTLNDHAHHLHGGAQGFDRKIWQGRLLSEGNGVSFSRRSADGEEGYPGALDVTVVYRLTEKNALEVEYEAVAQQKTVVNLTNHTYFNLGGAGRGSILDEELIVRSDRILQQTEEGIPTGKTLSVKRTPFDFRSVKRIGAHLPHNGKNPDGYNHTFVLDQRDSSPTEAAKLSDRKSGRTLTIFTNEPALHLYTGNFLGFPPMDKLPHHYEAFAGVCLEAQKFPDAPHHANFPSTILRPGETYRTKTIFAFGKN